MERKKHRNRALGQHRSFLSPAELGEARVLHEMGIPLNGTFCPRHNGQVPTRSERRILRNLSWEYVSHRFKVCQVTPKDIVSPLRRRRKNELPPWKSEGKTFSYSFAKAERREREEEDEKGVKSFENPNLINSLIVSLSLLGGGGGKKEIYGLTQEEERKTFSPLLL